MAAGMLDIWLWVQLILLLLIITLIPLVSSPQLPKTDP